MRAESLFGRAIGMKAAEHLFARRVRDAGAVVANGQFDRVHVLVHIHLDLAPFGGKRDGVVEQVFDHPLQTQRHTQDQRGATATRMDDGTPVVFAARLAPGDQVFDQLVHVDRVESRTADLRINPAGFRDFAHQPVDPAHVMRRDFGQLGAQVLVLHLLKRFERAAQGGEGVLDLMRHVGREMLYGVDALAQRFGHVRHRAGEQADLVAALGQAGHFHVALPPLPHAHGRTGQTAQRYGDRSCHVER